MPAKRKGNPNWTKGRSGNPGGRKKLPDDIVRLCREVTVEATETLIELMRKSDEGDPAVMAVRARAADSLLNRGWGVAPQTVVLQGDTTIRIITPLTKGK